MAELRYGYKYAKIDSNGMCFGLADTTEYFLDPMYVPISDDTINYFLKYYYPIPETITSFDDWQGLWYLDSGHTQLFEEGNI